MSVDYKHGLLTEFQRRRLFLMCEYWVLKTFFRVWTK